MWSQPKQFLFMEGVADIHRGCWGPCLHLSPQSEPGSHTQAQIKRQGFPVRSHSFPWGCPRLHN